MIQSLDRGLRLLEAMRHGPLSVVEGGRLLGVDPSTASRLLATLRVRGLAEQDPESGHFRLGIGALRLGWAFATRFGWVDNLKAAMRSIHARCGETVLVSALDGARAVYLDRIEGTHRLRTSARVGDWAPWHAGASGKAILAHLPDAELAWIVSGIEWVRYTQRTIMSLADLEGSLAGVRRRGYATSREEIDTGVVGVALPVWGPDGRPLGAIGVTAPLSRMNEAAQKRVAQLIRTALPDWAVGLEPGSRDAGGGR